MQCSFTENSQENKKALEAFSFKDERKTAPWYHLDSRTPSRRRPCRVPAHSCAVTGAPVAAYALGQSAAQLQDHVRPALPCPFSPLGALFDGSSGVLFSSSSLRISIFEVLCSLHGLPGAVNGEGHRQLLPSPSNYRRNPQRPWKTGRNFAWKTRIGLQVSGKTAIMFR